MVRRLAIDARKMLLTDASEEARRRGDRRLGTEHLLLALLHDPDSIPARALGVSLECARDASDAMDRAALAAVGVEVGRLDPLPVARSTSRRLPPITSGARMVFRRAIEEARPNRGGLIETRHFLLALLARERPDPAAELMHELGIDPSDVRERLARLGG